MFELTYNDTVTHVCVEDGHPSIMRLPAMLHYLHKWLSHINNVVSSQILITNIFHILDNSQGESSAEVTPTLGFRKFWIHDIKMIKPKILLSRSQFQTTNPPTNHQIPGKDQPWTCTARRTIQCNVPINNINTIPRISITLMLVNLNLNFVFGRLLSIWTFYPIMLSWAM